MGSKQSSSNNFKNQKRMRKQSQDYSSGKFFIAPETVDQKSCSSQTKQPISEFEIKNFTDSSNCQKEERF